MITVQTKSITQCYQQLILVPTFVVYLSTQYLS